MSLMKNRKSLMLAVVAAALVFVTFGSITIKTQPKQSVSGPSFQYVVSKTDIKKGDTIKEEDVEIKDFKVNIEGTYKASGEVIGRTADADISAGKPIIKDFIAVIDIANKAKGAEPVSGFRAVPVLIRADSIPPYLAANSKFDLFTRESSMKIENVRILNILDPANNTSNKMLVLEIKNADVQRFIEYQTKTKGFIFVQKSPDEYGDYKFYDILKSSGNRVLSSASYYDSDTLPSIEKLPPEIDEYTQNAGYYSGGKQVELIVGNKRSKMEF